MKCLQGRWIIGLNTALRPLPVNNESRRLNPNNILLHCHCFVMLPGAAVVGRWWCSCRVQGYRWHLLVVDFILVVCFLIVVVRVSRCGHNMWSIPIYIYLTVRELIPLEPAMLKAKNGLLAYHHHQQQQQQQHSDRCSFRHLTNPKKIFRPNSYSVEGDTDGDGAKNNNKTKDSTKSCYYY